MPSQSRKIIMKFAVAQNHNKIYSSQSALAHPRKEPPMSHTIDTELGEALQENEEQIAKEITEALGQRIEADHRAGRGPALRDAHPRAHGCVEAEFRVNDDVRPDLAQGVFVPGTSYRAWI